jgi:hypothetical protein
LGAIASYDDQRIHFALPEITDGLDLGILSLECWTARTSEDRAAALDDSAHVARAELDEVIIYQPGVPMANSENLPTPINAGTDDCANGRVNSWRVSSTRYHSNLFHGCFTRNQSRANHSERRA